MDQYVDGAIRVDYRSRVRVPVTTVIPRPANSVSRPIEDLRRVAVIGAVGRVAPEDREVRGAVDHAVGPAISVVRRFLARRRGPGGLGGRRRRRRDGRSAAVLRRAGVVVAIAQRVDGVNLLGGAVIRGTDRLRIVRPGHHDRLDLLEGALRVLGAGEDDLRVRRPLCERAALDHLRHPCVVQAIVSLQHGGTPRRGVGRVAVERAQRDASARAVRRRLAWQQKQRVAPLASPRQITHAGARGADAVEAAVVVRGTRIGGGGDDGAPHQQQRQRRHHTSGKRSARLRRA